MPAWHGQCKDTGGKANPPERRTSPCGPAAQRPGAGARPRELRRADRVPAPHYAGRGLQGRARGAPGLLCEARRGHAHLGATPRLPGGARSLRSSA
eukprot:4058721-Pyramimonas_sp.AAC.1